MLQLECNANAPYPLPYEKVDFTNPRCDLADVRIQLLYLSNIQFMWKSCNTFFSNSVPCECWLPPYYVHHDTIYRSTRLWAQYNAGFGNVSSSFKLFRCAFCSVLCWFWWRQCNVTFQCLLFYCCFTFSHI